MRATSSVGCHLIFMAGIAGTNAPAGTTVSAPVPGEGDAFRACQNLRVARTIDLRVAQRIRERRLRIGMTQQRLARMIGVAFQQAHKYEHGLSRIRPADYTTLRPHWRRRSPISSRPRKTLHRRTRTQHANAGRFAMTSEAPAAERRRNVGILGSSGAVLVEFALLLPVLVLVMMGTALFGLTMRTT